MMKYRIVTLAIVALLSVSLLAARVEAADGIMMKDGKMMMKDGKATGPMDHEVTMPDGHKVMPDGTMKMNDGKEMRMQEGQMMTMDGKMMEGGKGMMEGGKGMMGGKGIDYFENSRRATHIQQQYAICNPLEFVGYGQYFWGLTASDGPGQTVRMVQGVERPFFDYVARGVPYGPDDGTIAPWAVVASLPFAPEIVLPTVRHFKEVYPEITGKYCFKCSFNLTFPHESQGKPGWTSLYHYGINLGPVVLMCENYRSGLLWRLSRRCPYLVTGLRRAGFANGWL